MTIQLPGGVPPSDDELSLMQSHIEKRSEAIIDEGLMLADRLRELEQRSLAAIENAKQINGEFRVENGRSPLGKK